MFGFFFSRFNHENVLFTENFKIPATVAISLPLELDSNDVLQIEIIQQTIGV